jgi:hypothetical protein
MTHVGGRWRASTISGSYGLPVSFTRLRRLLLETTILNVLFAFLFLSKEDLSVCNGRF